MRRETFHLLKQAYLGHVDKPALLKSAAQEKDPFLQRAVYLVTNEKAPRHVPWNVQLFTTEFRKGVPRERLEETLMVFFLRFVAIIKEEMHIRTFQKPESHAALHAWTNLFKLCLFSVLSLLFRVEWDEQRHFELDRVAFALIHEGKSFALRHFMERDLRIRLATKTTLAEQMPESLNFLTIGQFGSSFWRLLHWMAAAVDLRDDGKTIVAKEMWREIVTGPLYRLLRCGICMGHLQTIARDLNAELMDAATNYGRLWFNIHNKVNATRLDNFVSLGINLQPQCYSESEFEQDAEFMVQALVP